MNQKISFFILMICALCLGSCFKEPNLDKLDYELVVATDYDVSGDFSAYQSYFISDTLINISSNPNDSIIVGAEARFIVDKIKREMNARGFQFVSRVDNPDLGILGSVVKDRNFDQVCYGWWWGYPGYYPGGWWGYPGYGYNYPYCSYYQYNTGSLNIEMFDLKNVSSNDNINVLWNSISFGVLSSYEQTNLDRAATSIEQAFEQSPYIQN